MVVTDEIRSGKKGEQNYLIRIIEVGRGSNAYSALSGFLFGNAYVLHNTQRDHSHSQSHMTHVSTSGINLLSNRESIIQ